MFENINIFSLGGLTFFLLILSVGYYTVEIIGGKNYWYRHTFENYSNNFFDRIMHYVTWGLLINLGVLYGFIVTDGIKDLINILNTSGKIAETLGGDTVSAQLLIFICFYYISLFTMLVLVNILLWLFTHSERISVWILERGKVGNIEAIDVSVTEKETTIRVI